MSAKSSPDSFLQGAHAEKSSRCEYSLHVKMKKKSMVGELGNVNAKALLMKMSSAGMRAAGAFRPVLLVDMGNCHTSFLGTSQLTLSSGARSLPQV